MQTRICIKRSCFNVVDSLLQIYESRCGVKVLFPILQLAIGLLFGTGSLSAQQLQRFEFSEPHLGTNVQITLYAPTEVVANEAADAGYFRIRELNQVFSDYDGMSETAKLCRSAGTGTQFVVSPDLFDLLTKSLLLSQQTDGAFDVTISPVIKLWRTARRQRVLPDPAQLENAKKLVGWRKIVLRKENQSVELTQTGMLLDFGGIAKGYIAQQACDAVRKSGCPRCLVAVAGDIATGDPPLDANGRELSGWRVGVAPLDKPDGEPSRILSLKNMSVSTSGDAFQFVEINGVRYSHIVDPKTGLGLTHRSSVTTISSNGAIADGLATALTILKTEDGMKLLHQYQGAAALVVVATPDGVNATESPTFRGFLQSKP